MRLLTGSRSRRYHRGRRAVLGIVGVLIAGVVSGVPVARATVAAAPARAVTRPNVVLILTDDQTFDSISKMPYVGSRTDWIKFTDATVENPMCCPSRSTILTGRWDTHTHVQNNGQAGGFNYKNTIGVWLHNAGYRTALVGKFLNNYPQSFGYDPMNPFEPPGWTDWQAAYGIVTSGPKGVIDTLYNQYDWELSDNGTHVHFGTDPSDYEVNVLADRALSFIQSSGKSPFFLYFAPTATHGPFVASPTRQGMFANAPVPHPPSVNEADVSDKPAYIRQMPLLNVAALDIKHRRAWAAAVSIDDAVARIDDQLKAQGVFDNTVEIFMTDNGLSFGEHRWSGKSVPYQESVGTPLFIRYPGLAARTVPQAVSNVDIASTISALAGVTPGLPQDGKSLLPLLTGDTTGFVGRGTLLHWPGTWRGIPTKPGYVPQYFGVRTARYTYVEYGTGECELYDHAIDPYELTNMCGNPSYAAVQARLAAQLARLRAAALS
jgi:arylsulfatase A-like enzyme